MPQELDTQSLKSLSQRRAHQRVRAVHGFGKSDCEHTAVARRFSAQRDCSLGCFSKVVGQLPMTLKILLTVGGTDVAATQLPQGRVGAQTHRVVTALGIARIPIDPRAVIASGAPEVRGENYGQSIGSFEAVA